MSVQGNDLPLTDLVKNIGIRRAELNDTVELQEKQIGSDPRGRDWKVILRQPGPSSRNSCLPLVILGIRRSMSFVASLMFFSGS